MIISYPLLVEVGADGCSGGMACKIARAALAGPNPTEFFASIVNSYVTPSVKPVTVKVLSVTPTAMIE